MPNRLNMTILGGGIAGLSAAFHAKKLGWSPQVYEAETSPGGLLKGFEIEGFYFDQAVHLSFADEPEVRRVFDQTPSYTHIANAYNFDNGYWLRHPAQNNLHPLPADEKVDLIDGLINRPSRPEENYEDWLLNQYGTAIAERWPIRYARKYWRTAARDLSLDWIGNRMRKSNVREVLKGAFSDDKANTYYVNEMRYPREGGYAAFLNPILQPNITHTGHTAAKLLVRDKKVIFSNGRSEEYAAIISTIPLPTLISIMDEVPDTVREAAARLYTTSIDLISMGFTREITIPSLWFYIYDEDIEAARAYSPSWKSPANAPEGKSSLQFEIYSGPSDGDNRDADYLVANSVEALTKLSIADPADLVFVDHRRVDDGNVVFYRGMTADRAAVHAWLEAVGIGFAGRFGQWDYLWSHQAFISGREAANKAHRPSDVGHHGR